MSLSLDQRREDGGKGAVLLYYTDATTTDWTAGIPACPTSPLRPMSVRGGCRIIVIARLRKPRRGRQRCLRSSPLTTIEMKLKTLSQLTVILLIAYALKSFYSTATVDDLRWILAPTTFLVELISGDRFTFESLAGYMSSDHTFLIAASCSGVNFLMISFLVLTLGKLWRERAMSWAFLPIAALGAYSTTLIANTFRIVIALQMHASNFQFAGFDAEELHRIEGIIVYFVFLLLLFIAGERIGERNFAKTLTHRSAYLLFIYYAVTLGIPIMRGGFRDAGFWEHAGFVVVVPLLFVIPLWIFSVTKRIRAVGKASAT